MWDEKCLARAIDDHVTGRYDPNAPWNQPDESDNPICNSCNVAVCDEPCEKLKKYLEKLEIKQHEEDMNMFRGWLESTFEECRKCSDLDKCEELCEKIEDLERESCF